MDNKLKEPKVGDACIFADPTGKEHNALITAVWGPNCVNVVYVNPDPNQSDTYGQKITRFTSVMRNTIQEAHGNFWY